MSLLFSVLRERSKGRSPHWPAVRKAHLRANPACAACESKILLQVHHVVPFHEAPERELDPTNLVTLCAWNHCHINLGHGGAFSYFNPMVLWHVQALAKGSIRSTVIAAARWVRKPNDGPDVADPLPPG